jgi:hypothetical protein
MTAHDKILLLFEKDNELTIKEIVDKLGISKQMAHIAVKKLTEQSRLEKLGRPPKTIYRLLQDYRPGKKQEILVLPEKDKAFLEKEFLAVTESGNLLSGIDAFAYWCKQRKLPVEKTLGEYIITKEKYTRYYEPTGMVNGLEKLRNTKGYANIWLDDLHYLDFYAIERFGKTRLGTLLHFAKQGQNQFLMRIMIEEIRPRIIEFLQTQKADAVGFIPPTIRRELQLMKFIQTQLNLSLPVVEIRKISGMIPVPQKSLSKLEERIRNADNTFAITERRTFNRVILIDDAVGSGSTLNQIAGKIKEKGVAKEITGLAVVGSFKGFDVITDV